MKSKDTKYIIDHFNELLDRYGVSEKAVGWPKKRNLLRYKILIENFNLNKNKSILDFGCGLGHFNMYLKSMNIDVQYEGVDINQRLVDSAIKEQPGINIRCLDALQAGLNKKYNYIVSCGVHNSKISDNISFIEDTFHLFNRYATDGFSMNFLSSKVDYINENNFHVSPSKIIELAMQFSNNVLLRHDYMSYEFSIIVIKNCKTIDNLNIFEKYKKFIN